MSGALFGSSVLGSLAGGALSAIGTSLVTGQGKQPKVQAPEAPPASQAAQLPNQVNIRKEKAGGTPAATLLTGPQGISTDALNIGRNTLLGS